MTWVRLDEEFSHHPKVLQTGPLGIAMQVAGLCYCNKYLTDGFIPRGAVGTLLEWRIVDGEGAVWQISRTSEMQGHDIDSQWVVDLLVTASVWHNDETLQGCESCLQRVGNRAAGYVIHDYTDYQPSKAEVLELREKRKAAGQKGGEARAKAFAKQVPSNGYSKTSSKNVAKLYPVSVPVPDRDSSLSRARELAQRINSVVKNPNPSAMEIAAHLLAHVDHRLVDECIGWAAERDESMRPKSPAFFRTVVTDWAKQRGIEIPQEAS